MNLTTKILCACFFVICSLAGIAGAQDATDMVAEEEMYFASGTVAEVADTQIVINEYDFDAGEEIKATYQINAQTQFEGTAGAKEIKAGDDVEIEYQMTGDEKIATRIEKYAPELDEEVMEAPAEEMMTAEGVKTDEAAQELKTEGEKTEAGN